MLNVPSPSSCLDAERNDNHNHNHTPAVPLSYRFQLQCRWHDPSVCTCMRLIGFGTFFGAPLRGHTKAHRQARDIYVASRLEPRSELLRRHDRVSLPPQWLFTAACAPAPHGREPFSLVRHGQGATAQGTRTYWLECLGLPVQRSLVNSWHSLADR
jgi:hypothetical protein